MTEKKPKEVRRREILDAAQKCFTEKGRHDTTIDDIAKESNLTKGGIYWHFKDKREIYIALIERHLHEDLAMWNELMAGDEAGSDLIIKAGISYLRYSIRDRRHLYLHAEFFAESFRDEVLRAKLNEVHREWRRMIKGALQRALEGMAIEQASVDVEGVSCIILSCIEGLMHQYWLGVEDKNVAYYEKAWTTFATLLLKAIQAQKNEEEEEEG